MGLFSDAIPAPQDHVWPRQYDRGCFDGGGVRLVTPYVHQARDVRLPREEVPYEDHAPPRLGRRVTPPIRVGQRRLAAIRLPGLPWWIGGVLGAER